MLACGLLDAIVKRNIVLPCVVAMILVIIAGLLHLNCMFPLLHII